MAEPLTIFAEATASGQAAIAVIRISGPAAHATIGRLAGGDLPPDRRMRLRSLVDPASGDMLDRGLAVLFAADASPTGEPYGELHVHGGVAVTGAVLAALAAQPGVRTAVAGEFARRALFSGKMDLSQVEAVSDLVAAQTSAQRLQALRLLSGGFGEAVAQWRQTLLEAAALLEAALEFADEGLPSDLMTHARALMRRLAAEIAAQLAGLSSSEMTREGFEVAITGAPNVGKSSLLNAIAGRDVAITSSLPGTTRDVIEVRCAIGGQMVVFLDTAGLRETTDLVEQIGVARARDRAAAAFLRLEVRAPDCAPAVMGASPTGGETLLVWNKADLAPGPGLNVSAASGEGIAALLDAIAQRLRAASAESGVVVRRRHAAALRAAVAHLAAGVDLAPDLAADEVRWALRRLDSLLDAVDSEDVLGEIFSRFCIGK